MTKKHPTQLAWVIGGFFAALLAAVLPTPPFSSSAIADPLIRIVYWLSFGLLVPIILFSDDVSGFREYGPWYFVGWSLFVIYALFTPELRSLVAYPLLVVAAYIMLKFLSARFQISLI